MLLRSMRAPAGGGPSPLARLLAIIVVAGLLLSVSPVVLSALRWFVQLF